MYYNHAQFLMEANAIIESSTWISRRIDDVTKKVEALDIDFTDQHTIDKTLHECELLLARSKWEEAQTEKFIEKYKLYE